MRTVQLIHTMPFSLAAGRKLIAHIHRSGSAGGRVQVRSTYWCLAAKNAVYEMHRGAGNSPVVWLSDYAIYFGIATCSQCGALMQAFREQDTGRFARSLNRGAASRWGVDQDGVWIGRIRECVGGGRVRWNLGSSAVRGREFAI